MTDSGPSRSMARGTLPNVEFINRREAGDSRRNKPSGGFGSAWGWGTRGWPSFSALGLATSIFPLGVGNTRLSNWTRDLDPSSSHPP